MYISLIVSSSNLLLLIFSLCTYRFCVIKANAQTVLHGESHLYLDKHNLPTHYTNELLYETCSTGQCLLL